MVKEKEGVFATHYKDKKDIMLLTTTHSCKPKQTTKRVRGADEMVQKQEIVLEYNTYMKGVDQMDQYLAFCSFNSKTLKWWKRAATHLLHLARVQAHIIYRKNNVGSRNTMSVMEFTLCLISGLVAGNVNVRRDTPMRAGQIQRLSHKSNPHFLVSIPATDKKAKPTKRCLACCVPGKKRNEYARRKETRYMCKECCHEIYHTHYDYTREIQHYYQME